MGPDVVGDDHLPQLVDPSVHRRAPRSGRLHCPAVPARQSRRRARPRPEHRCTRAPLSSSCAFSTCSSASLSTPRTPGRARSTLTGGRRTEATHTGQTRAPPFSRARAPPPSPCNLDKPFSLHVFKIAKGGKISGCPIKIAGHQRKVARSTWLFRPWGTREVRSDSHE